jgi:hypothetical protein
MGERVYLGTLCGHALNVLNRILILCIVFIIIVVFVGGSRTRHGWAYGAASTPWATPR